MSFSPTDLAIDQHIAGLSSKVQFLLEITPTDADEARDRFLSGTEDAPEFAYRDLQVEPDVADAALDLVPMDRIEDATLAKLLGEKLGEMRLQIDMLRHRDTPRFRELSVALHGGVDGPLLEAARHLIEALEVPVTHEDRLDAPAFLARAEEELVAYRRVDPGIALRAEIRPDVSGVLCEGDALIISQDARIFASRVEALLQHEVGTHLVTQVNGTAQAITTFGTGLAGYDETQEGLAVLAEIAVGGLTAFRLRQLAARVITVDAMLGGATFRESHEALVDAGIPAGTAFTTVMRVHRGGGYTKDAIYLRGLLDLLTHVRAGGSLDHLFLGKFALRDLPLVDDLHARGLLAPARIMPRYLSDPASTDRIQAAAHADELLELVSRQPAPTN